MVGRTKKVFWAPAADTFTDEELPRVAARPAGFRYRWEAKGAWEQLAHDMIVVSCGWRARPDWMPPALCGPAAVALGRQLRQDVGSGDWVLRTGTIVRWLARAGLY